MIETVSVAASTVAAYFQQSEGEWHSQRRYYTLNNGETQEVVSWLTVKFLPQGSEELVQLARLHQLEDEMALTSGAFTTWESNYIGPGAKTLSGSTRFGVAGTLLYRDRGFSTPQPLTAQFVMNDPQTLCLRSEYSGHTFEEEIKLIGTQYRTRQTVISRAGAEQMIGQYLEKRLR